MRALAIVMLCAGIVHAEPKSEPVALLPLDADARLEIYGQPVASEIARALVAGDIDVVVVGPKMAVPTRAKIVVGGTIAGKGDTVVLTLRVRNPIDGTVLATVEATAPTLANIDRAAADVSARVLPAVREQLEQLAKPAPAIAIDPPAKPPPVYKLPSPPVLVLVDARDAAGAPLRTALEAAALAYAGENGRETGHAKPAMFVKAKEPTQDRTLALGLEVLDYTVDSLRGGDFAHTAARAAKAAIPIARARVRLRIASMGRVFDRVVVTDSVVGDRDQPPAKVAERVAREVMDIARAQIRRFWVEP